MKSISKKQSLSREDMILSLAKSVRYFAKLFYSHLYFKDYSFYEDMIQSGWLGAIQAVDLYNEEYNTALASYAKYRIRGEIFDFLRSQFFSPKFETLDSIKNKAAKDEFNKIDASLAVASLLDSLSASDRYVIMQYYFNYETLKSVSKTLNVKEARVSQIKTEICNNLKEKCYA